MKSLKEKIKESTPTLVVFQHAGNQNAVDVKYLTDKLRSTYQGRADIVRVDCSYDGQMKVRYRLNEYPTWILFKEGQELMRESGDKTFSKLSEMIGTAL